MSHASSYGLARIKRKEGKIREDKRGLSELS